MDAPRRVRAPGGVRFAAWLIGINAFFFCLLGVVFLVVRFDKVAPKPGQTMPSHGVFQVVGFIFLAIGLLEFLLAYALVGASNGARIITTILMSLGMLSSLFRVLAGGPAGFGAWIQLVIGAFVIFGLWGTPNATEFFAKDESPQAVPPVPPAPPGPTL